MYSLRHSSGLAQRGLPQTDGALFALLNARALHHGEHPRGLAVGAILDGADIFQIHPHVHLVGLRPVNCQRPLDTFADEFERARRLLIVDLFVRRLSAGHFDKLVEDFLGLRELFLGSNVSRAAQKAGEKNSRRQTMAQVHEPSYFRA